MSGNADIGDLDNSLPSWISDHLGENSYMADEITQLPSSPREDPSSLEGSPSADALPSLERETNNMTHDKVERLDLDWVISKFFHVVGQATNCS